MDVLTSFYRKTLASPLEKMRDKLANPLAVFIQVGDRYAPGVCAICVILVFLVFLSVFAEYTKIEAWRTDSLYYLAKHRYLFRVKTEGRWLNYYLFDYLRLINPFVSAAIHLFCLFIFVQICSYRISRHYMYSILLGLLVLSSVSLWSQFKWPVTTLPAFILLAFSAKLKDSVKVYEFFCVMGIWLFGSMSYLYFLLPFLFLSDFSKQSERELLLRERAIRFITQFFLPWLIGFIAGYIFSTFMAWFETGAIGIELTNRGANKVGGLVGLRQNLARAYTLFTAQWLWMMNIVGYPLMACIGMFLAASIWKRSLSQLIIVALVIFSLHASTIVAGIRVEYRTILNLWVGAAFLYFVVPNIRGWSLIAASLIALFFAGNSFVKIKSDLDWYQKITSAYKSELVKEMKYDVSSYSGIAFVADNPDTIAIESHIVKQLRLRRAQELVLSFPTRWPPIARELGFKTILQCLKVGHPACKEAEQLASQMKTDKQAGLYESMVSDKGLLIVRWNQNIVQRYKKK